MALSGGWVFLGGTPYLISSKRFSAGAWGIVFQGNGTAAAFVECLKDASGATVTQRSGVFAYNGNGYSMAAACNTGESLVGGGIGVQSGQVPFNFLAGGSNSTWTATVVLPGTPGLPLAIYAECLAYANAHVTSTPLAAATPEANSTPTPRGYAFAGCPSGSTPSGGGFNNSKNSVGAFFLGDVVTASYPTGNGWEVWSQGYPGSTAFAQCVSFS
jgi:hypothetical protein